MNEDIYGFSAKDNRQQDISFEDYRGKVLLVVNTASECGFTGQYEGLEQLYSEYREQGLEVLAFPCNQFGGQEPGSDEEIATFCQARFQTSFLLFSKVDVNGEQAHPVFRYLTTQAPGILGSTAIKWNFTKFLVDRKGKVVKRFAPKDAPDSMRSQIEELLAAGESAS